MKSEINFFGKLHKFNFSIYNNQTCFLINKFDTLFWYSNFKYQKNQDYFQVELNKF